MTRRAWATGPVLATALLLTLSGVASAHPEGPSGREDFQGEGVSSGGAKQHDGTEGHLPAKRENVTLIGKGAVTNPADPTPAGRVGRVADVAALGNYAYLTAFRDPACEAGGVHVMDITDLSRPTEVTGAFMPTSVGSYAGEGAQVLSIKNKQFKGDVLLHNNETCPGTAPAPGASGGINLWDVSNPTRPVNLARHAGDYTAPDGAAVDTANSVHSMFAWNDKKSGRSYVVLVDNEELADLDIMDITDPRNPVMVNDTLDLVELFGVDQDAPAGLTSIFSHDMTVVPVGDRMVMTASYWDGGYVLLDVTDPRPGQVSLIAESDYAALDEERLARGQRISPEGNAHQSELSPDRKYLIGTDEDFNPYRLVSTIDNGTYAGTTYTALQAGGTPTIDADTSITGPTTFVGLGCAGTVPAGSGTALIQRGTCSFQEKLDTITAQGYDAGIVFNSVRPDCAGLVNMLASSATVPLVFVDRATGLRLLNQPLSADPCTQAAPAPGTASAATTLEAVFDGWGYVRLFGTDIPKKGGTGSMRQLDTYAIPESQDPRFAVGFGDLSVHEVAMDAKKDGLAYLSYYAGGLRVVEYGKDGLTEVGAFIDEGGSNFWGVEHYQRGGKSYVLASDRDFGLYVLQYDPKGKGGKG